MPPHRAKTWGQFFKQIGFFLAVLLVVYLYCEYTFPSQFRHLYPQKFQSHQVADLSQKSRSWQKMSTLLFNTTLASMCEDIEVTLDDMAYCVNENNQIVEIDVNNNKIKKLYQLDGMADKQNRAYGLRLSRDQKILYFTHTELGLCQFQIKTKKFTQLFTTYLNKKLIGLNSIQTHPTKQYILYITECSSLIPLKHFQIDILMNLPNGRVFQFNKQTQKLSLLADGLYFANGIMFQQYNGQQTVLVAESNRFRLTRIWVSGESRGTKQIAVKQLDMYLDNMKANQKGQIWIAGPSMRNVILHFADYHPFVRRILSRIPLSMITTITQDKLFGGAKIKFTNNNKNYKVQYVMWDKINNWKFTTTMNQKNDKLYISSLKSKGVMVVDGVKKQLKKSIKKANKEQDQQQSL